MLYFVTVCYLIIWTSLFHIFEQLCGMQDAVYRLWLGTIEVTKVLKIILVSKTSFTCFLLEATARRVGHPVASVTPTLCMFSSTGYMNLLCGLPLSNIFTVPPPHHACSDHLSLASLNLSPNYSTWAIPLIYSFLILSVLVRVGIIFATHSHLYPQALKHSAERKKMTQYLVF